MRGPGPVAALAVLAWLAASPASAAEPRTPGSSFRDCDACPEMVVVAAGSFVMGRPGANAEAVAIDISRPFALARHEITRGEFVRFVAATGHDQKPGCRNWDPQLARFNEDGRRGWQNPATPAAPADDHPVSCVSFADATAYVQWLARESGERYRLPSEAEWEYAARSGSAAERPWGDAADAACDFANTYDLTAEAAYRLGWPAAGCRDGYADVAPVGQFESNAFGIYDLIGNVQEWVQDCASGSFVGRPRDGRAWEWLGGCKRRVLRGGGWYSSPDRSRSAYRSDAPAGDRSDDTGFRIARDLAERGARSEDR